MWEYDSYTSPNQKGSYRPHMMGASLLTSAPQKTVHVLRKTFERHRPWWKQRLPSIQTQIDSFAFNDGERFWVASDSLQKQRRKDFVCFGVVGLAKPPRMKPAIS
jgi:hypothetical protein